ncbi:MAG: leucine-rich repeat domain-containing protein, partial [Prevotella sp.]|nr:leucine-rich repeat domain-containing protein [Prevotella sp.]
MALKAAKTSKKIALILFVCVFFAKFAVPNTYKNSIKQSLSFKFMKTLKLLTATMLLSVAMAAGAETISHVTIGNLVYSLDTDTKVATVTGYYSSNEPTDVVIPNTIEYGGNYSVTTIGAWAFAYCTSLTSIDIPNSVTTIGELAFF